MNFLNKFGITEETIKLIMFNTKEEKGKIYFPFSLLDSKKVCSYETINIDGTIRNAESGLFIFDYDYLSIKNNICIFDNILNLLHFLDKPNKTLFVNTVFVVLPLKPNFFDIKLLLERYHLYKKVSICFNNNFTADCKKIILTSYLNMLEDIKINIDGDYFEINIQNKVKRLRIENFRYKLFISLYKFPIKPQLIKPKGL